ncbi:MAG: ribulose-phosphate 3-epimerase [Planctomycetota bacterium]|jgi:ribulose-phosphate 3-epimerase
MPVSFANLLAEKTRILVAPSLLASDFSRLGEEIQRAEAAGADMFHLDVMDGHFVPNLTIGPLVLKAVRPVTGLPIEAHLMITDPLKYAPTFAQAGADGITFHIEVVDDPPAAAAAIRDLGVAVGVSLNPPTPLSTLDPLRGKVDYALVMTVNPGFGGQAFMPEPLAKVEVLAREWGIPVIVDGGVSAETAPAVAAAGARILVAGTAVFGGRNLRERIDSLRAAATAANRGES